MFRPQQPGSSREKISNACKFLRVQPVGATPSSAWRQAHPLALPISSCRKKIWVTPIFDVTHVVPHNLRPCAFAQHAAGMHAAQAPKTPFIAIGRV